MAGSRAVSAREPGQVREEAALSESAHAPRIGLAGAEDRRSARRTCFDDGCTVHFLSVRRALPILIAAVALAGCGGKTIDADEVEDLIREGSANERVIESITCPEDVKAGKGDRFECEIEITDGSEEAVTIEQLDDEGSVRVLGTRQTRLPRGGRGVTIKAVNAERLVERASPLGKPLRSVRCPDGVPLKRGDTFECAVVAADGERAAVTIAQQDDLGNIRLAGVRRR